MASPLGYAGLMNWRLLVASIALLAAVPSNAHAAGVIEFQGEPVADVLKSLGKDFGKTVFVDASVRGAVTLRLEDKSPKEAFSTVIESKKLAVQEWDGGMVVHDPNPAPMEESGDGLNEAVKTFIATLSEQVQAAAKDPRVTDAFAEYYWNLFTALQSKGFTDRQAIVILTSSTLPVDFTAK